MLSPTDETHAEPGVSPFPDLLGERLQASLRLPLLCPKCRDEGLLVRGLNSKRLPGRSVGRCNRSLVLAGRTTYCEPVCNEGRAPTQSLTQLLFVAVVRLQLERRTAEASHVLFTCVSTLGLHGFGDSGRVDQHDSRVVGHIVEDGIQTIEVSR